MSQLLMRLQSEYSDIVSYKVELNPIQTHILCMLCSVTCASSLSEQGRPYHEKMRYDRTEMLYWLQQERRRAALSPAAKEEGTDVVVPTLNL